MNTINQGASSGEGRLLQLAERVEAATGPDRELDISIHTAVTSFEPRAGGPGWQKGELVVPAFPGWKPLPAYSSSFDAALTLTLGLPEDVVRAIVATAYQWWSEGELTADRLARCITAAALKARAAQGAEPCR